MPASTRQFPDIRPLLEARLIEALSADLPDDSAEEVAATARELLDFAEARGRELKESREADHAD